MPNARCYLPRGDAKGEQAGKPGRQTPTEGDPPAALALQRTGSPTICGLFI
ncbi:hypothetical protein [Brasilonema sennae]|uniref:hypothetical protein n=1 Tax=Brasilonema sennae TaxID=1397703 RepID=UPI0030D78BE0